MKTRPSTHETIPVISEPMNPGPIPVIHESLNPALKYSDLTHAIIGCAMEVHKVLGNGFQEVIYQRALEIELEGLGIPFTRESEMPIFYKGFAIGRRRVDFFVDNKIMVELKALIQTDEVHLAQALNYLEAFNMEIGLLLNFGSRSLQFKRLLNKKYRPGSPDNPNPGNPNRGNPNRGNPSILPNPGSEQ